MNQPNMDEFYESIGKEMHAKKNRVRNIIGATNWGEEGKYKEIVLKKIIQHYLPQDISIGTGFIATKTNESISTTKQIDLILYKNSYPPLFREEDFVILHPDPICAIIEVKTNIRNVKKELEEILKKASRNAFEVLRNKKQLHSPPSFFNGIFSYDTEMDPKAVLDAYRNHWDAILNDPEFNPETDISRSIMVQGTVNYMCLNQDIYIKPISHGFGAFQTKQQAPAFFLSNLVTTLKYNELYGCDNWLAFPRVGGEMKCSIELKNKEGKYVSLRY